MAEELAKWKEKIIPRELYLSPKTLFWIELSFTLACAIVSQLNM